MDLLAVSRHQVDALFDRLFDTQSATTTRDLRFALEHVNRAEIERRLRPLGIQKPGVAGSERLVKGLGARVHPLILFACSKPGVAGAAELRSAATLSPRLPNEARRRGFPARGILIPLAPSGLRRCLQLRLELLLQDLSRRALGEGVDELHRARVLVSGQALLDEFDDVLCAGLGAGLERDDRFHLLAKPLVGDTDDGRLGHGGMCVDDLLDLTRVDVEAASDDHLLLAIDDEEEAVLVDIAQVAGVEPAAFEGFDVGLGLVPVTLHDIVATNHDLTDVVLARGELLVVDVEDPDLDPEYRLADAEHLPLRGAEIESRGWRCLRQAVTLEDRRLERALESLDDLARDRGPTRRCNAQR